VQESGLFHRVDRFGSLTGPKYYRDYPEHVNPMCT